ncbi:MAG TPA: EamA family transporter [Anaerolinea thermolimosa]|uniref:EamA family transporter n=1 Tax=Anaerolinea thermolimosa TaxID=229919 RepID=A0A3D1JF92_9CHLR|nr:EamA family transporter [Anaerolinea thermolimosa]
MNSFENRSASATAIWVAMISVYITWGSTYLAIRFAVQTMPPFLMAGFRFLLAGFILYFWRRMQGDERPRLVHWRSAAIIGLFLLLGGNGGVVWAEQRVVSGVAALLVGATPLWMVLIDWVRGIYRPALPTLAGVLVGFVGIALLIGPAEIIGLHGAIDPLGAAVLVLASFLWAAGSLYSRNASLPSSPLLATGMEMLTGGLALTVLGTLSGEWARLNLAAITWPSWLGLGYLVVFGSLVGFTAYTWLLRVAPTTLVSTYAYVNPVVAVVIGNLLADEPLTLRVGLSTAIIVGAVALITFTRPLGKRKTPSASSLERS